MKENLGCIQGSFEILMALRTPAVTWSLPPMHASPLRCTSRQRGSLLGGGGSFAQQKLHPTRSPNMAENKWVSGVTTYL